MCRPNNKISKAAAQAFIERRPFRRDNTDSCAVLKLHGHVIGENSASRGMHLTMAARLNAVMLALGRGTTATGCWRARTKSWK